jgi:ACS family hexuronate transporter-like MFS transporter
VIVLNDFGIKLPYRWAIVAVIWFSHTVYFFNYMIIGTLAPFMKDELNLTSPQIGLLSSAVTIGSMLSQVPAGILVDFFGARGTMSTGLFLVALSALAISMSNSFALMFFMLVILGFGIGFNQTPGSSAIIRWFPSKGRATAMGIKQTGVNMGGMLASLLLPLIALHFGSWRFSSASGGMAAVGCAVVLLIFYKDPYRKMRTDVLTPIFGREMVLLLIGNRQFLLICFAGIFLMAAQFAFSTYFVLYCTSVLNLPIAQCGTLLAISFISGAFGRVGWSLLSDYVFEARRNVVFMIIGLFGSLTSLVLIMLNSSSSPVVIYVSVTLFGFVGLGWNALFLTKVGEFPGEKLSGVATGLAFIISNVGAILGPPFFGYFVDLFDGYSPGWIFIAFCMCSVSLLMKMQKEEASFGNE